MGRSSDVRIGIDASNLRRGGGVTHLAQVLRAADPAAHGCASVVVWGGRETLSQLPMDKPWLTAVHDPLLDGTLPARLWWQRVKMSRLVRQAADVLFVPGGSYGGDFSPFVTMFRNMLPFDHHERARYGWSWEAFRFGLLERYQAATFRRAAGIIFLSEYAEAHLRRTVKELRTGSAIIPHGIAQEFFRSPLAQRSLESCTAERPFKLLYVSTVDLYKHQWNVVKAVARLRSTGVPVTLSLTGAAYPPALRRLQEAMSCVDPERQFIHYLGAVAYSKLPRLYHEADAFVFASSCENLPNILLEAMAAGLPIACSNRGPMPDILGEAGSYFDPEDPESIAQAVREQLESAPLRADLAERAYSKARAYSWTQCAASTFEFLRKTAAAA